jgi:prepilin-type N-terminal cleavage/methylation domain-containing protein
MSRQRLAFSLIELLVVCALIGVMATMAMPSLGRATKRAELASATNRFSRTVTVARQSAIMRGKRSFFKVDNGTVWVTVDTGGTAADSVIIVRAFPLDSTYKLASLSPTTAISIEFDPRGVATQPSKRVFQFVHQSGLRDSLCVSKLGNSIRTVCP